MGTKRSANEGCGASDDAGFRGAGYGIQTPPAKGFRDVEPPTSKYMATESARRGGECRRSGASPFSSRAAVRPVAHPRALQPDASRHPFHVADVLFPWMASVGAPKMIDIKTEQPHHAEDIERLLDTVFGADRRSKAVYGSSRGRRSHRRVVPRCPGRWRAPRGDPILAGTGSRRRARPSHRSAPARPIGGRSRFPRARASAGRWSSIRSSSRDAVGTVPRYWSAIPPTTTDSASTGRARVAFTSPARRIRSAYCCARSFVGPPRIASERWSARRPASPNSVPADSAFSVPPDATPSSGRRAPEGVRRAPGKGTFAQRP